jgi:hypothetical protein
MGGFSKGKSEDRDTGLSGGRMAENQIIGDISETKHVLPDVPIP